MEFEYENDRRLYDNAKMANENVKMIVEKQGEILQCLIQFL
jgi:hypothetical protein